MSDRDAQLRGSLLTHARLMAQRDPDGWVSGSHLLLAARDADRLPIGTPEYAAQLLADLVELGLLDEKAATEKGIGAPTLDHRKFRITAKGRELCWGRIDDIPGVDV